MNDDLSVIYNDMAFEVCDLKTQVKNLSADVTSLRRANFDLQKDVELLRENMDYVRRKIKEANL